MIPFKDLFIKVCYLLVLSSITLKACLLCFSITEGLDSSQIHHSFQGESEQQSQLVDLFSQSIINWDFEILDHSQKLPRTLNISKLVEHLHSTFTPNRIVQQFFPSPSICSHTGIYLCLRL
jgi:hypothetical protein